MVWSVRFTINNQNKNIILFSGFLPFKRDLYMYMAKKKRQLKHDDLASLRGWLNNGDGYTMYNKNKKP